MTFDLDEIEKLLSIAEKALKYPSLKFFHDEVMARLEKYRPAPEVVVPPKPVVEASKSVDIPPLKPGYPPHQPGYHSTSLATPEQPGYAPQFLFNPPEGPHNA